MQCMVDKCEREAKTRGVCPAHYRGIFKLIATGKTNWPYLEEAVKVLPAYSKKGILATYLDLPKDLS